MTLYPTNAVPILSSSKIDKPVEKSVELQTSTTNKADFLKNQLAALAILGASLIGTGGLTSCAYDDSSYDEIDIPEKVTCVQQNTVEQSLVSNIKNICDNLNIETGINVYGTNAACNKVTYEDGSYDEVYSQLNTSKVTPDTIYTNGLIIHRNISEGSPYYNLQGTGVKYSQRITQDKNGNLNIVRKYLDDDDMNKIKKGDIESITISAQDNGFYMYNRTLPNGEIKMEKMYNDGTNTFVGNSVIEPFSTHTGGEMPIPIAFNPTVEEYENV